MHMPAPESLRRAIAYFRQALYIDPGMSRAWAGQAFAWRTMPMVDDVDPREAFLLASAAVDRALEIEPDLAEAHSSRAFIHFWYDWDWARAEAAFQRAIARDTHLAEARLGYAHLLNNLRRFDDAICQIRRARELDPLSPIIAALEAGFLQWAGRSDEAAVRVEHALALAPDFWVALLMRGTIALECGAAARAIADLERAGRLSGGSAQALSLLGIAYVEAGRRADTEALLAQLEGRARGAYVPATAVATLRNALGDTEGALGALEQALAQRDLRLAFIQVDRRWDNLRSVPTFVSLVRTLGLDPPSTAGWVSVSRV
jgi:tetratricopeptide (TPR) repeat protein